MTSKKNPLKKISEWKFYTILSLVFVMLIFLVSFINATVSTIEGKDVIAQEIINHLDSVVTLKENQLDLYFDKTEGDIELLSYSLSFIGSVSGEDNPYLTEDHMSNLRDLFMNELELKDDFSEIFMVFDDGVVYISTDTSQEGLSKEEKDYFIEGQDITFTQRFSHSESGINPLTISTPIFDDDGNSIGILAGNINFNYINRIMSEVTGLGVTGETYLVDEEGYIITNLRFVDNTSEIGQVTSEGVLDCLAGNEGYGMYKDYRGIDVLGYYRWVDDRNICILAEIDQDEAFAVIGHWRKMMLVYSIFLALFGFILALIISRIITNPINRLTESVNRITHGELDIRLKKGNIFEINSLIRSLNRILASMKLAVKKVGYAKEDIGLGAALKAKSEAESRFKTLVEEANDSIIIINFQGKILYANKKAEQVLGYPEKELIKLPLSKFMSRKYLTLVKRNIEERFKGNVIPPYNIYLKKKDGSIFEAEITGAIIDWAGQKADLVILRDLTQRRKRERMVEDYVRLFEKHFDISFCLMISLDEKGKVVKLNKAGQKILGWKEKDIKGRDWFKTCIPLKERKKVRSVFDSIMKGRTKQVKTFENSVKTKSGKILKIRWHNTLLKEDGKIVGTLSSGMVLEDKSSK